MKLPKVLGNCKKPFPANPDKIRRSAGFTFIEFVLVIALISAMYLAAVPNFSFMGTAEVQQKLEMLAIDIKSGYDMSVLHKRPYRLVFNLSNNEYWLEACDRKNFTMAMDYDGEDVPAEIEAERAAAFDADFKEYEDLASRGADDYYSGTNNKISSPLVAAKGKLRPPTWSPVDNREWGKRYFGDELMITAVETEHHRFPVEIDTGAEYQFAMIYIFPTGYIEKAVIRIAYQGDDELIPDETLDPYTAYTLPYRGMLVIEGGHMDVDVHGVVPQ